MSIRSSELDKCELDITCVRAKKNSVAKGRCRVAVSLSEGYREPWLYWVSALPDRDETSSWFRDFRYPFAFENGEQVSS